jgi:hypothetical protein
VSIRAGERTKPKPGTDLRSVVFPRPAAPVMACQGRRGDLQLRGERVERRGRNVPRRFGEPTLKLKEFQMDCKPQPVVIDAIREELPFGVGQDPMGGKFVGAPGALHGGLLPCIVMGMKGS